MRRLAGREWKRGSTRNTRAVRNDEHELRCAAARDDTGSAARSAAQRTPRRCHPCPAPPCAPNGRRISFPERMSRRCLRRSSSGCPPGTRLSNAPRNPRPRVRRVRRSATVGCRLAARRCLATTRYGSATRLLRSSGVGLRPPRAAGRPARGRLARGDVGPRRGRRAGNESCARLPGRAACPLRPLPAHPRTAEQNHARQEAEPRATRLHISRTSPSSSPSPPHIPDSTPRSEPQFAPQERICTRATQILLGAQLRRTATSLRPPRGALKQQGSHM